MQTKDALRAQARQLRAAHRNDATGDFLVTLTGLPVFSRASAIAIFLSSGMEPPTAAIMAHCQANGQRVGVPAWSPETKAYRFCDLLPGQPLAPGPLRIPEPVDKQWVDAECYDLFLIPGLLFDARGTRLGHGRGHYDRLLAGRAPHAVCAALAFDWQLAADPLPCEPHDIPMDLIVTPGRIITCGGRPHADPA